MPATKPQPKVPAEPFVKFLELREVSIKSLDTATQRAIHRAKRSGAMTVYMADALAIAFGRHPVEIWGDAWLAA